MRLTHHNVCLTGAAQGIGLACARLMAQEGANLFVVDCRPMERPECIPEERWHPFQLDVALEASWEVLECALRDSGQPLHVLVNNAGIIGPLEGQDPEHCSVADWEHIHAVNALSTFLGCRMALRLMKEHGGSVVNVSSRSGMVGIPTACAYASSKASIRNHSKSVALYGAPYRIRCNSVHPGAIDTPLWDAMLSKEQAQRTANQRILAQQIPLQRMGTPEDVAHAVVFLASPESSYITGTELTIDGGILAGAAASPAQSE